MFTVIVVAFTVFFGLRAHTYYVATGRWKFHRLRLCWAAAFIGALMGCSIGIAGFGGAVAGTIPGALFGYLAMGNLVRRDFDESDEWIEVAQNDVVAPRAENRHSAEKMRTVAGSERSEASAQNDWKAAALGFLIFAVFAVGWLLIETRPEMPHSVSAPHPVDSPSPPTAAREPDSQKSIHLGEDLQESSSPLNADSNQVEASRECRFKGVMTNDDYRACGISPP